MYPRTFGYESEGRSSVKIAGEMISSNALGFEQTGQNLPGRAFRLDQCADDYIGVKDGSEHSLPAPSFARAVLRFIRDPFGLRLGDFFFDVRKLAAGAFAPLGASVPAAPQVRRQQAVYPCAR
jgi:hypothetical protein